MVTLTNSGNITGAEVVQLYVASPQVGIHRPLKELKGFQKVLLAPGESKRLSFLLDERSFAIWCGGWKVQKGTYTILVGGSSRDLPLKAIMEVDGIDLPVPEWQTGSWYETLKGTVNQSAWEAMSGIKYKKRKLIKGHFTMDNTVEEMKDYSFVMRLMYKGVEATIAKGFGGKKDYQNPEFRMLMSSSAGSPLRSMQISGGMKGGLFKGLLDMANGHYLRGLMKLIRGE